MEGRGAYSACRRKGMDEWIIVKSICDWGVSKEGNKEKNQIIASESAVPLLKHIFSKANAFDKLPIKQYDVKAVTRKYSILNYNGIDEELTRVLTASIVTDDTSGLSYQITTVMTEPNDEAMKILKNRDDMAIKHEMTKAAGKIVELNKEKTYADAIWEEAAKGSISDVEAIQRIEEYEHKSKNEKLEMLLKLRDEGIISDMDISVQSQGFLPSPQMQTTIDRQIEKKDISDVDALFNEED